MENPFVEQSKSEAREPLQLRHVDEKGENVRVESLIEEYHRRKADDVRHELLQDLYGQLFERDAELPFRLVYREERVPPSQELVQKIEERIENAFEKKEHFDFIRACGLMRSWFGEIGIPLSPEMIRRYYDHAAYGLLGIRDPLNTILYMANDPLMPKPDAEFIRMILERELDAGNSKDASRFFRSIFFEVQGAWERKMSAQHVDTCYRLLFAHGYPLASLTRFQQLAGDIDPTMLEGWLRRPPTFQANVYLKMLDFALSRYTWRKQEYLPAMREGLQTATPTQYDDIAQALLEDRCAYLTHEQAEEAVRTPWHDMLQRLKKIQARSENKEHDPWENQLDPLVAEAEKEGLISQSKYEDGELLIDFVKRYGMNNLPNIFRWTVWTGRAKTIDDLTPAQKQEIANGLGIKAEKFKNKGQMHVELKRMQEEIRTAMFADGIPPCFERAPIAAGELFSVMKGTTSWKRDYDLREIVTSLKQWKAKSPEEASLPEGYERARMEAAARDRRTEQEVQTAQKALCKELDADSSFQKARKQFYDVIVNLQGAFFNNRREMPIFWKKMATELSRELDAGGGMTPNLLRRMRSFLLDYLEEHELHPAQEEHRTGHAAYDAQTLKGLRKMCGLEEPDKNPILMAHQNMEDLWRAKEIENKIKGTVKKFVAMDLVPVRGLLRTYAGDVGDACYTSRHEELAKGEYPDLTAFILVVKAGTAQESLAGSVLAIEARTPSGESVLMVRANNPRQNVIAGLDAKQYVKGLMEQMIALAKRRGIKAVVVPIDNSGQSSSNREDVSNASRELFESRERIALQRSPETGFNGYENWDAKGPHACALIWHAAE